MRYVAAILAGGVGRRFGGETPKQFLLINGRTVLAHTLDKFEKHPLINEIVLVVHEDYLDIARDIVFQEGFKKVCHIVPGGKERYHSTLAALDCCEDNSSLLIHDAARPLVSQEIISRTIEVLRNCSACTTAIPATDTILQSDSDRLFVELIPDRDTVFQVQTPQGFNVATLRDAYRLALRDSDFVCTDDCGVVKRYLSNVPIRIVLGASTNIKLTYREDIHFIERIL